ncbi:AraC family transcriptional regulator [Cohnella sp. JJ-181]|uniref:AraC family transcriptional regulator n=1 Tax=Cohnella rhizoplanae TaxID=2974897 RepID=UPI0022FF704A|nr:AraC family transcriptional regulator [Cohnella sp. JJ-181]CAI6087388.1 HTH-type transcriptional activator RhaR [Cohnella sp. JJ-181]
MDFSRFPLRRPLPPREWSPTVHYAQYQKLPPGSLAERYIYDFELICVCKGRLATEMRGERYTVGEGETIVLPSGVPHRNAIVSPQGATLLGIHFDFDGRLRIATESDMVSTDLDAEPDLDKFAEEPFAPELGDLSSRAVYPTGPECFRLMDGLVGEFTMRRSGYELACKSLMLGILAMLLRTGDESAGGGDSVHRERIRKMIEAMEREPGESWSAERIARELKVSEDYAAKLFRQVAGMPPGRMIQSIRLREARRLLRETDWSVETVGARIGYPDLHYFSRVFTAGEGISPREYRKLSRVL